MGQKEKESLTEALARGYQDYIKIAARAAQCPDEEAQEALHEVASRLLGAARVTPGAIESVVAWRPYIITAAINDLKDRSRQVARRRRTCVLFSELDFDGRREVMSIPDPRPTPEEMLEAEETGAILWGEVASLSPREADVVKRWACGASYAEIATVLGIKASTVRKLWSKGIGHLRMRPRIRQLAA